MRGAFAVLLMLSLAAPSPLRAQASSLSGPPMEVDAATRARLLAAMKADLRNLVTAQEAYFAERAEYAQRFARGAVPGVQMRVSAGVTVTLTYVTKQTYAARAIHDWLPGRSCVMIVGDVASSRVPVTTAEKRVAAVEGVPVCDSK